MICSRNDAEVGFYLGCFSHPCDDLLFRCTQNFRLKAERHIRNFIKEKCSLVAYFKKSHFIGDGPGKRPLFMTKELAFKKRFRDCTAVHRTKDMIFPGTGIVNDPGDVFLPCSTFTRDQYIGIGII